MCVRLLLCSESVVNRRELHHKRERNICTLLKIDILIFIDRCFQLVGRKSCFNQEVWNSWEYFELSNTVFYESIVLKTCESCFSGKFFHESCGSGHN